MEKNQSNVISGLSWSFAERILAQLVSTVVGIVLARLLAPDDYGIISIVMVFITFYNVFATSGLGTAIVQKKEVDETDYNTAFWLSILQSVLLYLLLFFTAPYISAFYERPILTSVIRVLGLRLIVTSLNTIQQAYLQRAMAFRKFFVATLFGTIVSCVVGIVLAYNGFGVWALVAQYLTNTTIDTIVLCFVCGWNPKFKFSKKKAKEIYSFGWKVLGTELVFTLESDIRSLAVGRVFGTADLAFYDQGRKYPSLLVDNINNTIQKVMLPTFSRMQDDKVELKNALRRCIRLEVFLLAPFLVGFAAIAQIFVSVLLTDKWMNAVPFIWIFCASYLTRPIESSCHQAFLALGKSGLVLCIMILINVTSLTLSLVAIFILKSVMWVALFSLFSTIVSVLFFLVCAKKIINYRFREQLSDMLPSLAIALIMGGIVFALGYIPINKIILMMLQILCGIIVYLTLSVATKMEPCHYLISLLRNKFAKSKKVESGENAGNNVKTEFVKKSKEGDINESQD